MGRFHAAIDALLSRPDGQRTLGLYSLEKPLGAGGFAPVWLATESFQGHAVRSVALKVLPPGDAVVEEARALCRIEHPNVVRFYGLAADASNDVVGLVMELVKGRSLHERLEAAEGSRLPLDEVVSVGIAIASALRAVHQSGLVHRDVKPHNVIECDGTYKLIDFGIAIGATRPRQQAKSRRIVLDDLPIETSGATLTTHSAGVRLESGDDEDGEDETPLAGTIGYTDPALMVYPTPPLTGAADLYSLGATLYECLTGMVPARAHAVVHGHAFLSGDVLSGDARAPDVRDARPDTPKRLAALVDALVSPVVAERPASAAFVVRELEQCRAATHHRATALPSADSGPFPGLAPYDETRAGVFFGREGEIAAALDILQRRGLVAVNGPSGVGITSLLRAGILPRLRESVSEEASAGWEIVDLGKGDAAALRAVVPDAESDAAAVCAALERRVASSSRGTVFVLDPCSVPDALVRDLVVRAGSVPIHGVRFLIGVNEPGLELLTRMKTRTREIEGSARQPKDRTDDAAFDAYVRLVGRHGVRLSPLAGTTWVTVLERALDAYGTIFDSAALGDEVFEELRRRSDAMPFTALALARLWSRRDKAAQRIGTSPWGTTGASTASSSSTRAPACSASSTAARARPRCARCSRSSRRRTVR